MSGASACSSRPDSGAMPRLNHSKALRLAPQHALDQHVIDHALGRSVVVAHEIDRQLRLVRRAIDWRMRRWRRARRTTAQIEMRQVALVEKPQRKALLGRVLFRKPGIRHRAQLRHHGADTRGAAPFRTARHRARRGGALGADPPARRPPARSLRAAPAPLRRACSGSSPSRCTAADFPASPDRTPARPPCRRSPREIPMPALRRVSGGPTGSPIATQLLPEPGYMMKARAIGC